MTMVSFLLETAKSGQSVIRVLCDDTDVFVLLMYCMNRTDFVVVSLFVAVWCRDLTTTYSMVKVWRHKMLLSPCSPSVLPSMALQSTY